MTEQSPWEETVARLDAIEERILSLHLRIADLEGRLKHRLYGDSWDEYKQQCGAHYD